MVMSVMVDFRQGVAQVCKWFARARHVGGSECSVNRVSCARWRRCLSPGFSQPQTMRRWTADCRQGSWRKLVSTQGHGGRCELAGDKAFGPTARRTAQKAGFGCCASSNNNGFSLRHHSQPVVRCVCASEMPQNVTAVNSACRRNTSISSA